MTTPRYKAVKLYVDEAEYDQAIEILRSQGNTMSRFLREVIQDHFFVRRLLPGETSKGSWRGEPIENLSKRELIEALEQMTRHLETAYKQHKEDLRMLE